MHRNLDCAVFPEPAITCLADFGLSEYEFTSTVHMYYLVRLPIKVEDDSLRVSSRNRLIPKSATFSRRDELRRQFDDFNRPWHDMELW